MYTSYYGKCLPRAIKCKKKNYATSSVVGLFGIFATWPPADKIFALKLWYNYNLRLINEIKYLYIFY
jgi:hypothetical protein